MKALMPKCALPLLLLWITLVCSACAGRSYLIVDYQVPGATQQLSGHACRLKITDQRENPNILAPGAGYHFRNFQDSYSLAWVMPDDQRVLAGEHDLKELMRITFSKRLEQMGVVIADASQTHLPLLTITLKQLRIDLKERQWSADLKYQADLTQNGRLIAKEHVQGNAQRVRIVGRKGADAVLSDIFSDAVNRIDLAKLFKRIKPIS